MKGPSSVPFLIWQPRAEEMDLGMPQVPGWHRLLSVGSRRRLHPTWAMTGRVCGDVRLCVPLAALYRVRRDSEDIKTENQGLRRHVSKVLAAQAWGPEFNSQKLQKEPGDVAQICNPSTGEPEL